MKSWFIPNKFNQGNFQITDTGNKSQDNCQELTVTTGHPQASSFEILRIFQNIMIAGWYMLQSSTEAKWSPNNSLIMKISEMDRLKQTETSSEKKKCYAAQN